MRLLVLVLNKVDKLEDILSEFLNSEISGATILSSTGMARVLSGREDNEEIPLFGSIRSFLNPAHRESKTIFAAMREEQIPVAVAAIEKVVGDLSRQDVGVVFTLPIDFVKGIPNLSTTRSCSTSL